MTTSHRPTNLGRVWLASAPLYVCCSVKRAVPTPRYSIRALNRVSACFNRRHDAVQHLDRTRQLDTLQNPPLYPLPCKSDNASLFKLGTSHPSNNLRTRDMEADDGPANLRNSEPKSLPRIKGSLPVVDRPVQGSSGSEPSSYSPLRPRCEIFKETNQRRREMRVNIDPCPCPLLQFVPLVCSS